MADTTTLKNRIRAAIKANDNQEITGPVLQQALLDIVDELNGATETEAGARQNGDSTLSGMINAEKTRAEGAENTLQQNITAEKNRAEGAESVLRGLIDGITENIENGYMYAGIATPSITPATGKVFYLALTAGTYTNFGNTEVSQGINILKYNGSAWSLDAFISIDENANIGGNGVVKGNGIATELLKLGINTLGWTKNGINYSTGAISPNNDRRLSELVPIINECLIQIEDVETITSAYGIVWYNEDKEFISGIGWQSSLVYDITSNAPSSAKYFRIFVNATEISSDNVFVFTTGSLLYNYMVDELNGATETEAGARQNGDRTLFGMINAEKTRAEEVETQLNNLITGIKNNIDNGYVYAGIAMPSTTPVSGKVFYVAVQAGTYTNFGGTAVTEGITILKYNGASWVKEQALFTDGGVFDISAYHATGGTLATYDNLEDALGTNGKNIPQSLRKGGMSVKFVQSSDNKYVQFRCMAQNFTTDVTQWQGVDDEPTVGSDNLVKSGGVRKELDSKFFTFTNQNTSVRKALDGILELYIKLPDSYIGDIITLQRIDRNYGTTGSVLVFWDETKSQHIYNVQAVDEDKNIVSFTSNNVKVYAVVDWGKFPNNVQTGYNVALSDAVYDIRNSPYIMAHLDDVSNRKDIDNYYNNYYKDVFTTKANAVTQIESPYKDKRITIIGDSISTFNKVGFTSSGSYYPKNDVNRVEFTWWDKVIGAFGGYSESNLSYSGSTASDACEQHNMGISLYKRTISDNIGNPDVIIIALGYNDVYWGTSVGNFDYDTPISELSESTFANAYIKGIKSIQNRFPNAEIICVWIGPNTSGYTKHINAIHDIASHYNLPYIVASGYSVIESVHPNKNGMNAIYEKVISELNVKTNSQKIGELASEAKTLTKEVDAIKELTSDNYYAITEINDNSAVKTQEHGAYFTDENGNAFMQYDENGFDVEKISESFKEKLEDDTLNVKKTSDDGVSIVTDALGNSAVYWDNTHGLDANKVAYNLAKSVKEKYIKNMEEWSKLGTGMFIHWGVYSVLAGHYQGENIDGQTVDYHSTGIAEWILKLARIPKETYQTYQSQFTAANWNADAVAKMAYDCGMKYIVITVKHHDGFVLYDSDYAPWDISTSGASGKDPLMELKNACEKYGLKFCTYFSHQKDWTAEGGWDQGWTNGGVDPYTEAQHKAYIEKTINILKEFISKYDPYVLWYDGDSIAPYNSDLYDAQKNYYPQVITNNRLFNTPLKADFACGEGGYFRGSMELWKYAENCYTTNGSWGYNEAYDIPARTINLYELIAKYILESKARNQNALINVGPKGDGAISDLTKTLFGELSDYVVKYGTFDNTRGLNYYTFPNWGRALIKGRTLRCYVWGGNTSILVDGVYTKYINGVHVWDIQNPESQDNYQVISDYRLQISNIPVNNNYPSLVDVEFGNDIIFEDYSNIIDDTHHIIGASAFQSNSGCSLQSFSSVPQFGSWTGSGNVSSIFLYNGTSGNYNVKLHIPSQQGDAVTITVKVKDMETGSATTLTATNSSTTTFGTVLLTNGHRYRIEVSKTASIWINLSKVEFINQ